MKIENRKIRKEEEEKEPIFLRFKNRELEYEYSILPDFIKPVFAECNMENIYINNYIIFGEEVKESFIYKYKDIINWEKIIKYKNLNSQFIYKMRKYTFKYIDLILENQTLSIESINYYIQNEKKLNIKLDYSKIEKYQKLNIKLIENNFNKFNIENLLKYQNFTEKDKKQLKDLEEKIINKKETKKMNKVIVNGKVIEKLTEGISKEGKIFNVLKLNTKVGDRILPVDVFSSEKTFGELKKLKYDEPVIISGSLKQERSSSGQRVFTNLNVTAFEVEKVESLKKQGIQVDLRGVLAKDIEVLTSEIANFGKGLVAINSKEKKTVKLDDGSQKEVSKYTEWFNLTMNKNIREVALFDEVKKGSLIDVKGNLTSYNSKGNDGKTYQNVGVSVTSIKKFQEGEKIEKTEDEKKNSLEKEKKAVKSTSKIKKFSLKRSR